MNTVQKNNNITKKELQEYMEKNRKKLGISEVNFDKLLKSVRSNTISREMRNIFYQECVKRVNETKEECDGKYIQLTKGERITIEVLYTAGFTRNFISNFIGRDRSTIGRELEKNAIEIWDINSTKSPYRHKGQENIKYYSAETAQQKHEQKRQKSRKRKLLEKEPKLLQSIKELLRDKNVDYSPEIIANLSKQGKIKDVEITVCANTIYSAIYQSLGGLSIKDMPHKMRYYKKTKNKHTLTKEVPERKKELSIEKMPEGMKESETYFEGDSIVGVRTGTHNTLITLVNKASQFLIVERSENKTAKATVDVLDRIETEIPELSKIMETLLLDNGVEFSDFEGLMESIEGNNKKRFGIYFAHPYASYERGSNENKNRLVRRYFKKGKLVESLSNEDILNIAKKINNMPRKALGYKTPLEAFEEILIKKNIDTKFLDKYRIEQPKCLIA